jgi:hypothetical protein
MANKRLVGLISVLLLISLLSISMVSAGWFGDFWNKITGKAVSSNQINCYDSDGGLNYYVKGYVNVSEGIIIDSCEWRGDKYPYPVQNCYGSMCYIYEANCRDYPPTYADISYSCPRGCFDGACVSEQENNSTKLKSDFFKNDRFALKIINGTVYFLKDLNLYSPDTGVGGSGNLNYNVTSFEYKILNAFRQLGYLGIFLGVRDGPAPDTLSTTALHRFQEQNNISLKNYLDVETLLLLDKKLYFIEQKDKADILNYPAFSAFSKTVPANEPPIEHIAALYYRLAMALPRNIPRLVESQFDAIMPLTVDELRHRITPPRQANFGIMLSHDGKSVLDLEEAIEVDNTKGDFKFCPALLYNGFYPGLGDCINPPTKIIKNIKSLSDYDFMYLIIHEYGHEVGKAVIQMDGLNQDIDTHLRKISFNERMELEGGGYSSDVSWLRQDNYWEFVTNYARSGTNQNEINPTPAWNAPYEDFAESFTFYLLQGKIFRLRAKENVYLQKKYDFLKKYVFMGREYNTGDIESYENLLKNIGDKGEAELLMAMSVFQTSTDRSTIWNGDYPYSLLNNTKYILTCQKSSKYSSLKYYIFWHTTPCTPSACRNDEYLSCEKKRLGRYYYREVCQKLANYNTACSETSTCGSDKEIKRTTC